jgi:hypothetical protein
MSADNVAFKKAIFWRIAPNGLLLIALIIKSWPWAYMMSSLRNRGQHPARTRPNATRRADLKT